MYTLEALKSLNSSYCTHHLMTDRDLAIVNDLIPRIEALRQGKTPQPMYGDRVICVTTAGKIVSEQGLLDRWTNERFAICTRPYIPFIRKESLSISASGGYWINPTKKEFAREAEYVGRKLAWFTVWGRYGAQAHGAIDFQAKVNFWKFTNKNFY